MYKLPLDFNDHVREIIHTQPEKDIVLLPGNVPMTFVWCPAGSFMMGSPETELGHYLNETLREEKIEEGFWIGKYPVTEGQYDSLYQKPSLQGTLKFFDPDAAKGCVNQTIAKDFCSLMNKSLDLHGYEASLPTSVQWEYACRSGCGSSLNNGTEITRKTGRCWNLAEVAWNPLDKVDSPQPVGKKVPNAWGIYDMHGNVWEWCLDQYIHITKKGEIMPPAPKEYVIRGGSFRSYPKFCRSACIMGCRSNDFDMEYIQILYKNCGFRVVLNKKQT